MKFTYSCPLSSFIHSIQSQLSKRDIWKAKEVAWRDRETEPWVTLILFWFLINKKWKVLLLSSWIMDLSMLLLTSIKAGRYSKSLSFGYLPKSAADWLLGSLLLSLLSPFTCFQSLCFSPELKEEKKARMKVCREDNKKWLDSQEQANQFDFLISPSHAPASQKVSFCSRSRVTSTTREWSMSQGLVY